MVWKATMWEMTLRLLGNIFEFGNWLVNVVGLFPWNIFHNNNDVFRIERPHCPPFHKISFLPWMTDKEKKIDFFKFWFSNLGARPSFCRLVHAKFFITIVPRKDRKRSILLISFNSKFQRYLFPDEGQKSC